jgi:hypothetical protein
MPFARTPTGYKRLCIASPERAAVAIALAISVGWSASASAGVSIAGTGAAGGMSATDATALQGNRGGGPGHIAIIPYFSTQGCNSTLINLTNTDVVNDSFSAELQQRNAFFLQPMR